MANDLLAPWGGFDDAAKRMPANIRAAFRATRSGRWPERVKAAKRLHSLCRVERLARSAEILDIVTRRFGEMMRRDRSQRVRSAVRQVVEEWADEIVALQSLLSDS